MPYDQTDFRIRDRFRDVFQVLPVERVFNPVTLSPPSPPRWCVRGSGDGNCRGDGGISEMKRVAQRCSSRGPIVGFLICSSNMFSTAKKERSQKAAEADYLPPVPALCFIRPQRIDAAVVPGAVLSALSPGAESLNFSHPFLFLFFFISCSFSFLFSFPAMRFTQPPLPLACPWHD